MHIWKEVKKILPTVSIPGLPRESSSLFTRVDSKGVPLNQKLPQGRLHAPQGSVQVKNVVDSLPTLPDPLPLD